MTWLDQRRETMNEELRARIERYRVTMSVAKEMREKGIISEDEYVKIDTIMAKKYGLSSSTIFK